MHEVGIAHMQRHALLAQGDQDRLGADIAAECVGRGRNV